MAKRTDAELKSIKRKNHELTDESISEQEASALRNSASSAASEFFKNEERLTASDYLDRMINEASRFTYDINADPLYQEYRDMYAKESSLAAKNVFGLASALTGGYSNSYALSAVSSAVSDYVDKLAGTAATLRNEAYEKHRDTVSDLYTAYKEYAGLEEKEYERSEKERERQENAEADKYSLAFRAAEVGDYSLLKALGIDISALEKSDSEKRAEFLADYGDYSELEKIGVDISSLKNEELTEIARLFASYGDYSLLNELGADTGNREAEDYYNRLLLKARYLDMLR